MGQLVNLRKYPTPADKVVTAPNADTLYSLAWLDLAKEPYVFSIPEAGDRYFMMPMLDAWTDVFEVPGTRTTGDKAQRYVITSPGWNGKLPDGLTQYKSPTALVWILGRTYCTGTPEDYRAVHAFQDKLSLVPLSSYGKSYSPPPAKVDPSVDMKTPVRDQVHKMGAAEYFATLASLLKTNPPAAEDAAMVEKMAKIGIVPGRDYDPSQLDPAVSKAMARIPADGQQKIMSHFSRAGKLVNGWTFSFKTGVYGTDYAQRAFITAIGLGANRPEDAVYPVSRVDASGKPYDGANKYVLRFAKGELPPVNAFWSLTMYDAQMFFAANKLDRFTLSQRDSLEYNDDGSVDLYIQHESPGSDKESNWLPAPAGRFVLMLRMYWPKESLLDGSWQAPGVRKAN
jgi:hypothetical protein